MPQATPLPNTLGEVVLRCQSLLAGAPVTGNFGLYTRGYLLPFINQAYEDMDVAIRTGSGKNLEGIVEALDVPTGTSSLYPLQQLGDFTTQPPPPNGPFAGLFDPLRIWTKSAGQLPSFYREARGPRETLPHVNPPGITSLSYAGRVDFVWIGNKLAITPVAGPIDIQLYGRFNPPPLVKDSDYLVLYPRLTAALVYAASALTGIERTNPQVLQGYATRAEAMLDNIIADIVKQTQKIPRRPSQMGGWGWR